jgi:hypothetical protein
VKSLPRISIKLWGQLLTQKKLKSILSKSWLWIILSISRQVNGMGHLVGD